MSQMLERTALDRLLTPVTDCLTPEAARRLVNLQPDPDLQDRLDWLADRCTEGELTPQEREEYETYVRALHLIALLQAKARKLGPPRKSP
jgi:hypothetical protein